MSLGLRVVEIYVSYQGEGPNTSRPTVFVRFAGCNFKCPGWPCDTQHAIQPSQFTKLQKIYSPADLAEEVLALGVDNICLTGGEVFLQNKDDLREFVDKLQQYVNVECFTNGALAWDQDIIHDVSTFILDWKLPGSGETYKDNSIIIDNLDVLGPEDAIKFTIRDRADYEVAKGRYNSQVDITRSGPKVYAGVVWGALDTEELCKWMIEDKLPWYLNVQVHKFIWHPDKIGV
jgi:7-carboxy-7-deazaguanine synthase